MRSLPQVYSKFYCALSQPELDLRAASGGYAFPGACAAEPLLLRTRSDGAPRAIIIVDHCRDN